MALKIRLRQQGRRNQLTYRLVVVDSRTRRDGKYIEMVGHYDPAIEGNKDIRVHEDRISYWLDLGAVLSENAHNLLSRAAPGVIKALREKKLASKLAKKKK